MEDLFPALIFIVIGVISSISKANKDRAKKDAMARHQAAAAARMQAAQAKASSAAPQPAITPVQPKVSPAAPMVATQPLVHTHYQPDCEEHDASGSLNFTSTEGKDPCHEEQLTHLRTEPESAAEESGLAFDWSGENLVKAFVMQEVLTRPAQRRAR